LQTFVDETKLTSNLKTSSKALFFSPWDWSGWVYYL
jgi:hypothetical protein